MLKLDTRLAPIKENHFAFDPQLLAFAIDSFTSSFQRYGLRKETIDAYLRALTEGSLDDMKARLNPVVESRDYQEGRKRYRELGAKQGLIFNSYRNCIPEGVITVLDVGCGPADAAQTLLRERPDARYIGTDIIPYIGAMPENSLFFLQQDAMRLPDAIEPESVDVAYLNGVLHHNQYTEQQELMREIYAKLKPGGVLCLFEMTFPVKESPTFEDGSLNANFMLLTATQRFQYIGMVDLIGNAFIADGLIPMPGAYRTLEEWVQLAGRNKLHLIEKNFIGIPEVLMSAGAFSALCFTK